MKNKNAKSTSAVNVLWMFVTAMLLAVATNTAKAKSLYVIADIYGSAAGGKEPVHAYDIGVDGMLTFQAQHDIPSTMLGAVGMAIDSDSGYLFITYEASGEIQLVDGTTMTGVGRAEAADATDLAGIVYDHSKKLLYCVDRNKDKLYVYDWDAKTTSLDRVTGSPFRLWGDVHAFGIALDEIDGLLYVGSASKTVTVYSTSDWSRVRQIELNRVAISVAVDVMNGFLYTGAGYAGNNYLTQYHLATGTETSVQVEPDAGVMGLGVDPDTGLVYMSTGANNAPGGDNLLVYDTELNRIGKIHIGGNPTALAIPGKDIGFNPLNLTKELVRGAADAAAGEMPSVGAGKTITYGIGFSNLSNQFTVTDVTVVDALSRSVTFVSADDDGVRGHYDSKTHAYIWTYADLPPGTSTLLELTVRVNSDVDSGTVISNSATINSNETAPTTTRFDVVATSNSLNLEKTILGAVEGQVARVEPNDLVTYTICFDNSANDFMVTDILLIDMLAPELIFVSADDGKASGFYDPKSHTYTWIPPNMVPGASACVGLVARVDPDLKPGMTITNSAIIDTNETPSSIVSVDARTSYSALSISKSIVGATEGKLPLVGPNEDIKYLICFENNSKNDINDLTIVDTLPPEVEVVKGTPKGLYDPKTHTYTWSHPSLKANSKSPTCVELTVRVNTEVPPATTISNSVTISSHETESATASVDATTYFPLDLTKTVIGGFGDDIEWVDVDDDVTYGIEYTNTNEFDVTDIIVTDRLPAEVSFVTATDDGVFGSYDPNSHTYQWTYPSLGAGESAKVELVVHVNPDVKPFKTIVNSATVTSKQMAPAPTDTTVAVITAPEPPLQVQALTIIPDMIRHSGDAYDVQAVMILPPGIGRDKIRDVRPVLKPINVIAKDHAIFGTATMAKVIANFDKAEILDAVDDYGYVTLKVKGQFNSGQSFHGEADVYIGRFIGN
ncbi:MAG: hypothetical protein AMJ65_03805 [Phycisphaerae bacterium SG8_4]|nr:MAG: hypothetical protein AMJ65_03805 [Phycisphaerae bacterium SG8_4]